MSHPNQPGPPDSEQQGYSQQYGYGRQTAPYGPPGDPNPYTSGSQPYHPSGPEPSTRRKRRRWPWTVGILAALFVLMAACIGTGSTQPVSIPGGAPAPPSTAPADDLAASNKVAVVYEIIGSGKAGNVTYNSDGSGSISQETDVQLPWRTEITVERGFALTSVTAQNGGSGEITCKISVDGIVVKEGRSSGQFSAVACAGEPIR